MTFWIDEVGDVVCPDHNFFSRHTMKDWCTDDEGRLHYGLRCTLCHLWLRWLPRPAERPQTAPLFRARVLVA